MSGDAGDVQNKGRLRRSLAPRDTCGSVRGLSQVVGESTMSVHDVRGFRQGSETRVAHCAVRLSSLSSGDRPHSDYIERRMRM